MDKRRLGGLNPQITQMKKYGLCNHISYRRHRRSLGQVAVEITFAFIVVFILFYTSAKIFVWFGDSLTNRQLAYEASRAVYNRNWWDGPQVQPSDVADLDSYLHDRRASYYNAPLDLVE
ncbi:MAG: hypothetical protein JRI96_18155 [Deltaproteobacteria bacterium]|nr:hypothetical protein [Deltaproteobacteria bacterium]